MATMTLKDLLAVKERVSLENALRDLHRRHGETASTGKFDTHLLICGGTGCHASGSRSVKERLLSEISRRQLEDRIQVVETGCNGFCAMGPILVIYPDGLIYMSIKPDDVSELLEKHLAGGKPVERLLYRDPSTGKAIPRMADIPFFSLQDLRVLRNRGLIDPENIEDYIARDGYAGMAKALSEMTPEEIISEISASGLRGRGGAGFPTGLKWKFASASPGDVKYVLCNADEGDPGAFMDRSVLEADPHAVLEGMIIAAKAIGSAQGYIYCRAEYPLAIQRLTIAIDQARERGLLGQNILGTGFHFDLEIYQGAGAFVCGEETALMTSIEGKRGTPRPRPPFPAVAGLWQKPSILNNVETLANVGQIILRGAAWYAAAGTEKSKGTKVFALTGAVNNVGLVEVPMGTPLGNIIYDIGGGIPKGKSFKAAQIGGPSGGCIPRQHLNAPVDYEKVSELGAIMGSGGLIVMDEETCAVDMARFFMEFCQDESCGKCTPCREGTRRMLEILTAITQGRGQEGDIERLEELAQVIKDASLCGLGQTAPNPVLSTLRYFRQEYEAHIERHHCDAAVCRALFKSPCQHTCPIGMDIPAYIALVRTDRLDDAYRVLLRTNPFPSVCGRVCDHKCQSRCRRGKIDEPIAIKYLKRYITDNVPRPGISPVSIAREERIAVIGAGPAGLTAARDLALRGYKVTVFEAQREPGGMLRWAIPAYRLPRDVLAREIAYIVILGVDIRCNTRIGVNISMDRLLQEYDRVYLAPGSQKSQPLGIPGEDLAGVLGDIEFLRDFNEHEEDWRQGRKNLGRHVVVIGGGNSAFDTARVALRLGADVTILYRRERKDMPAAADEIRAAEEEGIRIEYLAAPVRIESQGEHVTGLTVERMSLGNFDASGRRHPETIDGSAFCIPADTIISATGQETDLSFLPDDAGIARNRQGYIVTCPKTRTATDHPRIFAGGDAVTGPSSVIKAIAAGQHAAREIDASIRQAKGEPPYAAPSIEGIDIPFAIDEETLESPQTAMRETHGSQRRTTFTEFELGYSREEAMREARRCLRCDAEIP